MHGSDKSENQKEKTNFDFNCDGYYDGALSAGARGGLPFVFTFIRTVGLWIKKVGAVPQRGIGGSGENRKEKTFFFFFLISLIRLLR